MEKLLLLVLASGFAWLSFRESKYAKFDLKKVISKREMIKIKNYHSQSLIIRIITGILGIVLWLGMLLTQSFNIWHAVLLSLVGLNLLFDGKQCKETLNECEKMIDELDEENIILSEIVLQKDDQNQDRIWSQIDDAISASV